MLNRMKRLVSLTLTLLMLVNMLPVDALAAPASTDATYSLEDNGISLLSVQQDGHTIYENGDTIPIGTDDQTIYIYAGAKVTLNCSTSNRNWVAPNTDTVIKATSASGTKTLAVEAVAAGNTTIQHRPASSGGGSNYDTITVYVVANGPTASIVSTKTLPLYGESGMPEDVFNLVVKNSAGTTLDSGYTLAWNTDAPDVINLKADGSVDTLKTGTANVWCVVTVNGETKTATTNTCAVTIDAVEVTLVVNGEEYTVSAGEDGKIAVPSNVVAPTGYSIAGWSATKNGTTDIGIETKVFDQDTTLYAILQQSYTVTYHTWDFASGEYVITSAAYEPNTEIKLNALADNGDYIAMGWSTSPRTSGIESYQASRGLFTYAPDYNFTVSRNMDFYSVHRETGAMFYDEERNAHYSSYNVTDGIVAPATSSLSFNTAGWEHVGWSLSSNTVYIEPDDIAAEYIVSPSDFEDGKEYSMVLQRRKYTVTFAESINEAGEAVNVIDEPIEYAYGAEVGNPVITDSNGFTYTIGAEKDGKYFAGWTPVITSVYTNHIVTPNWSETPIGENQHVVTFVVNEEPYATVIVNDKTPVGSNMPADPAAGENVAFTGWVKVNGETFSATEEITEDMTVVATFKAGYVVRFIVGNDAETGNVYRSTTVKKNTTVSAPSVDPSKDGYKFMGWFAKDEEGNLEASSFNFSSAINEDIDLFAKFYDVDYLFYVPNGGTENAPFTYVVGETTAYDAALPTTTRVGYSFEGWYWGDADGNITGAKVTDPSAVLTAIQNNANNAADTDLYLVANWTPVLVPVTVVAWDQKSVTDRGAENYEDDTMVVANYNAKATTYTVYAYPGDTISINSSKVLTTTGTNSVFSSVSAQGVGSGNFDIDDIDVTDYFEYQGIGDDNGNAVVVEPSGTVLNVFYKRTHYTLVFNCSDDFTMTRLDDNVEFEDSEYSITAELDEDIADQWPYNGSTEWQFNCSDSDDTFYGWSSIDNATQVSMIRTMTPSICKKCADGENNTASVNGSTTSSGNDFYLMYAFESLLDEGNGNATFKSGKYTIQDQFTQFANGSNTYYGIKGFSGVTQYDPDSDSNSRVIKNYWADDNQERDDLVDAVSLTGKSAPVWPEEYDNNTKYYQIMFFKRNTHTVTLNMNDMAAVDKLGVVRVEEDDYTPAITSEGSGKYGNYSYNTPDSDENTTYTLGGVRFGEKLSYVVPGENSIPTRGDAGQFVFTGWYLDPGCNDPYKGGTMPDSDITLYAGWVINPVEVNYYLNEEKTVLFAHENKIPSGGTAAELDTDPVPSLEYGQFVRWYYYPFGKDSGYKAEFIPGPDGTPVTKNTDIYAEWKTTNFTVTYDGNITPADDKTDNWTDPLTYNLRTHLILDDIGELTKDGMVFVGWAEGGDEKKLRQPGDVYQVYYDVTFVAVWKAKADVNTVIYHDNFEYDSGNPDAEAKDEQFVPKNTNVDVRDIMFDHTGYAFLYWTTNRDGSGTHYYGTSTIASGVAFPEGTTERHLYAQWEALTAPYTVHHYLEDSTTPVAEDTYVASAQIGSEVTIDPVTSFTGDYAAYAGVTPIDGQNYKYTVQASGNEWIIYYNATISVPVTKNWSDNNDQDGDRLTSVTVQLYADDEAVENTTLNEGNDWTSSFTGLDKYASGAEIEYTFKEVGETGGVFGDYNVAYDYEAGTITNTKKDATYDTRSITVNKVWKDGSVTEHDGVVVTVSGNGKTYTETLSSNNNWSYTFTVPKNSAGTATAAGSVITYTVSEAVPEGFSADQNDVEVVFAAGSDSASVTFTNTRTGSYTEIPVTKVWQDNENQDGIRPESVTVNLVPNGGTGSVSSVTLSEDNDWKSEFTNVAKYDSNGAPISYTVEEVGTVTEDGETRLYPIAEGDKTDLYYTVEIAGSADAGYTVTNTHAIKTYAEITVTKEWDDANNANGKRPDSVTIYLKNDSEIVGTVILTNTSYANGTDAWDDTELTGKFVNIPVYQDGAVISYSIEEAAISDYTPIYGENETAATGFTVKNIIVKGGELVVTKTVDDADALSGQSGDAVADAEFTFTVTYADGTTIPNGTFILKDGENKPFQNLPIGTYKVIETSNSDYTTKYTVNSGASVSGNQATAEITADAGATVAFTNTRATESLTITKEWLGEILPDTVVNMTLTGKKADGTVVYTAPVTMTSANKFDDDTWKITINDLPSTIGGQDITYTFVETAPSGYEKVGAENQETYTVTNRRVQNDGTLTFTKKWVGVDGKFFGRLPSETTVLDATVLTLSRVDGDPVATTITGPVVTMEDNDIWTITYSNVPLYDENGAAITYKLHEDLSKSSNTNLDAWYTEGADVESDTASGNDKDLNGKDNLTNTIKAAYFQITKTVTDQSSDPVAADQTFNIGYSYNYTNLAGEQTDDNTVTLTAGDSSDAILVPYGVELTVSETAPGWEISLPAAAEVTGTEAAPTVFAVTNTRDKVDLTVEKTWYTIGENKPAITLQVKRSTDGTNFVNYGDAIILDGTEETAWTHVVKNVPTHDRDGKAYTYSVVETKIGDEADTAKWAFTPDYTYASHAFVDETGTVENADETLTVDNEMDKDNLEKVSISGEKIWKRVDDLKPEVTVNLYQRVQGGEWGEANVIKAADGTVLTGIAPATTVNGAYSFANLPKYSKADAAEIKLYEYKVEEGEEAGYETAYVAADGYTVVETAPVVFENDAALVNIKNVKIIDDDKQNLTITKHWIDDYATTNLNAARGDIDVVITRDVDATEQTEELTEANATEPKGEYWTKTVEDMPIYVWLDEDKKVTTEPSEVKTVHKLVYGLKETDIEKAKFSAYNYGGDDVDDDGDYELMVTNTIDQTKKRTIVVSKTWENTVASADATAQFTLMYKSGNMADYLPYTGSIEATSSDGNPGITRSVTGDTVTWTDLPLYDAQGHTIQYQVVETEPAGWTAVDAEQEADKFDANNKITAGTVNLTFENQIKKNTSITVTKAVKDTELLGLPEGSKFSYVLYYVDSDTETPIYKKDGVWTADTTDNLANATFTLTEKVEGVLEYNDSVTFTGLPYGTYKVVEVMGETEANAWNVTINGNEAIVDVKDGKALYSATTSDVDGANTIAFANNRALAQNAVKVTKEWLHDEDYEYMRPSITIGLKANSQQIDSVTFPNNNATDKNNTTTTDSQTTTWTGLPAYNVDGESVSYAVTETINKDGIGDYNVVTNANPKDDGITDGVQSYTFKNALRKTDGGDTYKHLWIGKDWDTNGIVLHEDTDAKAHLDIYFGKDGSYTKLNGFDSATDHALTYGYASGIMKAYKDNVPVLTNGYKYYVHEELEGNVVFMSGDDKVTMPATDFFKKDAEYHELTVADTKNGKQYIGYKITNDAEDKFAAFEITKALENVEASAMTGDVAFTFTGKWIDNSGVNPSAETVITVKKGELTASSGQIVAELGESVTITELAAPGWTPKATTGVTLGTDGSAIFELTVTADNSDVAAFTNTRDDETLTITKVWKDGNDQYGLRPENSALTFDVYAEVGGKYLVKDQATLSEDKIPYASYPMVAVEGVAEVSGDVLTISGLPTHTVDNQKITYSVEEQAFETALKYKAPDVNKVEGNDYAFTVTNELTGVTSNISIEKTWVLNNVTVDTLPTAAFTVYAVKDNSVQEVTLGDIKTKNTTGASETIQVTVPELADGYKYQVAETGLTGGSLIVDGMGGTDDASKYFNFSEVKDVKVEVDKETGKYSFNNEIENYRAYTITKQANLNGTEWTGAAKAFSFTATGVDTAAAIPAAKNIPVTLTPAISTDKQTASVTSKQIVAPNGAITVTEAEATGWAITEVKDAANTVLTVTDRAVTLSEPGNVTFVNTRELATAKTGSKTWVTNDREVIDANTTFTVTVDQNNSDPDLTSTAKVQSEITSSTSDTTGTVTHSYTYVVDSYNKDGATYNLPKYNEAGTVEYVYTIVSETAPNGYTVTGTAPNFTNTQNSGLIVGKIYAGDDEIDKVTAAELAEKFTFNVTGDGNKTFSDIEFGKVSAEQTVTGEIVYTITETDKAGFYVSGATATVTTGVGEETAEWNVELNGKTATVTVPAGQTVTVTFENDIQRGKFTVTKKGQKEKPLAGAEFTLYYADADEDYLDDCVEANAVMTKTTGADGKAIFDGIAEGVYWVYESKVVPGYQAADAAQAQKITVAYDTSRNSDVATVNSITDDTYNVSFVNTLIGETSFELKKVVSGATKEVAAAKYIFDVKLENSAHKEYDVTYGEQTKAAVDGIVEFKGVEVTQSGHAVFEGMPIGTVITVTEVLTDAQDKAWTTTWSSGAVSENVAEVTIPESGTATLTATNTMATASLTATKKWDDFNNKYSLRDSYTVQLKRGNEVIDTVEMAATDVEKTWKNLPVYNEDGIAYIYSVVESDVPEYYQASYDYSSDNQVTDANGAETGVKLITAEKIADDADVTITNTVDRSSASFTVSKVWIKEYNQNADVEIVNPELVFNLSNNSNWTKVEQQILTSDDEDGKVTFADTVKDAGYALTETQNTTEADYVADKTFVKNGFYFDKTAQSAVEVKDGDTVVEIIGFNVENTLRVMDLTITKEWDDNGVEGLTHPDPIFQLYYMKNGSKVIVAEHEDFTRDGDVYTINNIPYRTDYVVEETGLTGVHAKYFTIDSDDVVTADVGTATKNEETKKYSAAVTIKNVADDYGALVITKNVDLTTAPNWDYTTNSSVTFDFEISVYDNETKAWSEWTDVKSVEGIVTTGKTDGITVALTKAANGGSTTYPQLLIPVGAQVKIREKLTDVQKAEWNTVAEQTVEGFTAGVNKVSFNNTPKTDSITVTKSWVDKGDPSERPTVHFQLLNGDGSEYKDANGNAWIEALNTETNTATFAGLPRSADGYKVKEIMDKDAEVKNIKGYVTTINDVETDTGAPVLNEANGTSTITFINTRTIADLTINKIIVDGSTNPMSGKVFKYVGADNATVTTLTAGAEAIEIQVPIGTNVWIEYEDYISDKDLTASAAGWKLSVGTKDTVGAKVEGDKLTFTADAANEELTLVNTRDLVVLKVTKDWLDEEAGEIGLADEFIPDSLHVQVMQNGVAKFTDNGATVERDLLKSKQWADTFEGLPKYDMNGNAYVYTVTETLPEAGENAGDAGFTATSGETVMADKNYTAALVNTRDDEVKTNPTKTETERESTYLYNGEEQVKVGGTISYEMTWRNSRNEKATVTITDTMPTGLVYDVAGGSVEAVTVGGKEQAKDAYVFDAATAGKLTWTIENVPAFTSGTVTVTLVVTQAALDAAWKNSESDPELTNKVEYVINDTDGTVTTHEPAESEPTPVYNPHMSITKVADKETYSLNETIVYTITLTNDGSVDLIRAISLYDELDEQDIDVTEFKCITEGATYQNGILTSGLKKGESVVFTYEYLVKEEDLLRADAKTGDEQNTLTNIVTAKTTDPADGNPIPGATATEIVKVDDLASSYEVKKVIVNKPADGSADFALGEKVEFKITVENTGNVTIDKITLKENILLGAYFDKTDADASYEPADADEPATAIVTALKPVDVNGEGNVVELTAYYVIKEKDLGNDELANELTVEAENDPTKPDPVDPDPIVPIPVDEPKPAYTVVKEIANKPANGTKFALGETVKFTITVTNTGNVTLDTITIEEELEGAKFVNTVAGATYSKEDTVATITNLQPKDNFELKDSERNVVVLEAYYIVEEADLGKSVEQEDGTVVLNLKNKLEAEATYTDPNPDPEDPEPDPVKPDVDPEVPIPVVDPNTALTIVKEIIEAPANGEAFKLGETVYFDIIVTNTGNTTIDEIIITEELEGAKFVNTVAGATYSKEDTVATITNLQPKHDFDESESTHNVIVLQAYYTIVEGDLGNDDLANTLGVEVNDDQDDPDVIPDPIVPIPVVNPESKYTVVKKRSNEPANGIEYVLGEKVTFDITVTNTGNTTIDQITITEELEGAKFVTDVEGAAYNEDGTVATITNLQPKHDFDETASTHNVLVLKATYVIVEGDLGNDDLANRLTVEAEDEGDDPDPIPDPEEPIPVEEPKPAYTVVKKLANEPENGTEFALGETAKFTVTVTNTGNIKLDKITVTEQLEGAVFVNADGTTSVSAVVENLAVGASVVLNAQYTIVEADLGNDDLANTLTAEGEFTDPNPDPDEDPKQPVDPDPIDPEPIPVEDPDPKFSVVKNLTNLPERGYFVLGEKAEFTITVKNLGNVTLTVTVDETLEGATFTDGTTSKTVTLAPYTSTELYAEYTIVEADLGNDELANTLTAEAEYDDPRDPDKDPEEPIDPIPDPDDPTPDPENPIDPEPIPVDDATTVAVTKVWDDQENMFGTRQTITVNLLADGEVYKTAQISEADEWTYTFVQLPVHNADASVIEYTVVEDAVTGYDTSYEVDETATNVTITNTLQQYTLTINYWYNQIGGRVAAETFTRTYYYGESYNVTSPSIRGYRVDKANVAGVITGDAQFDVIYTPIDYNLTVYYVYEDGTTAAATHRDTLNIDDRYSVTSPELEGYVASTRLVSGTMPGRNLVYTVIYVPDTVVIEEYGTPLNIGSVVMNVGDCFE